MEKRAGVEYEEMDVLEDLEQSEGRNQSDPRYDLTQCAAYGPIQQRH